MSTRDDAPAPSGPWDDALPSYGAVDNRPWSANAAVGTRGGACGVSSESIRVSDEGGKAPVVLVLLVFLWLVFAHMLRKVYEHTTTRCASLERTWTRAFGPTHSQGVGAAHQETGQPITSTPRVQAYGSSFKKE